MIYISSKNIVFLESLSTRPRNDWHLERSHRVSIFPIVERHILCAHVCRWYQTSTVELGGMFVTPARRCAFWWRFVLTSGFSDFSHGLLVFDIAFQRTRESLVKMESFAGVPIFQFWSHPVFAGVGGRWEVQRWVVFLRGMLVGSMGMPRGGYHFYNDVGCNCKYVG